MLDDVEHTDIFNHAAESLDANTFPKTKETSFDSGYSASPIKFCITQRPPLVGQSGFLSISSSALISQNPQKMSGKFPMGNPSPFKSGSDYLPMTWNISPVKVKSEIFSPLKMKEEPLSPFKGVGLSPFKVPSGSTHNGLDFPSDITNFDDWDQDFIANFEENLFGINDVSDSVMEELMKSPQGKAMLERRNASPLRHGGMKSTAARQLRISPQQKGFLTISPLKDRVVNNQSLNSQNYLSYKQTQVKQEPTEKEYYLYTDENTSENIVLSVTDPNKMSATPIRQKYTNIEKVAPKRKLSMKGPGAVTAVALAPRVPEPQCEENLSPNEWPSKEKLKYARDRFKHTLAKAVEAFITSEKEKAAEAKKIVRQSSGKSVGGKGGKKAAKSFKNTHKPKSRPKERYPQIKKALSKPSVSGSSDLQPSRAKSGKRTNRTSIYKQSDWVLEDEEEEEEPWHGPPPFSSHDSLGFSDDGDESEDEYWEPPSYNRAKKCGYRVLVKKRKKDM